MKKVATLVSLVLLVTILLTACGSGSASMTGKWGLTKMEIDGEDYLAMLKEMDSSINVQDEMYFEFTADGKVSMAMGADEDLETGTYTLSGNKLTINADGEKIDCVLSGDTFTMSHTEDGSTMSMAYTKIK